MTPTCPNCGRPLAPVVGPPEWAPWLCKDDARGWWPSELSVAARAAWKPQTRDHGIGLVAADLNSKREADRNAAIILGTSVTVDMISVLSTDQKKQLATDPGVSGVVKARIKADK